MQSFPVFLRLSGQYVILLGSGEAADAKRRLYERAGAILVDDENHHEARIAIVAIEDEEGARAAVARLKSRGLLVNAVDRPALCDFTTPAIVDRAPVLIAIGTGGASAGLAKALRQRLEALLPSALGGLASALKARRGDIAARWPDGADRRRSIDAALAPQGPLDPLQPFSKPALDAWLADASTPSCDSVEAIALVSDDPDDLTLRQARWLGSADTVYIYGDVPLAIRNRVRADADVRPGPVPDPLPPGITIVLKAAAREN